jgi:hypothetical protein
MQANQVMSIPDTITGLFKCRRDVKSSVVINVDIKSRLEQMDKNMIWFISKRHTKECSGRELLAMRMLAAYRAMIPSYSKIWYLDGWLIE